eukprot:5066408-Prymnesium_polylepis.1
MSSRCRSSCYSCRRKPGALPIKSELVDSSSPRWRQQQGVCRGVAPCARLRDPRRQLHSRRPAHCQSGGAQESLPQASSEFASRQVPGTRG